MQITKPTKVANSHEEIWDIWNETRKFIPDNKIVNCFDEEFDKCNEDEALDVFEDVMDYINEEISPENLVFGVNKETEELGFWKEEDIYDGEDEENKEETSTDEEPEQEIDVKKEGVAEILDDDGNVIAETSYSSNPDVKVVCMDCKKTIEKGPEDKISHGICRECYFKRFDEYPEDEDIKKGNENGS